MPIYTRSGDAGSTSLFGGKRVLKCEELVDVYGSIDELNSWIGKIISESNSIEMLTGIQSDLFTIGSHLAGGKTNLSALSNRVKDMEDHIDELESTLPKLHNFILPGGTILASDIHVSRAVCRRVERQTVALGQKQTIDNRIVIYLNRLSDLLFMLARSVNTKEGTGEVVWSGIDRIEKIT